MNLTEKEKDLIAFANNVIAFKTSVIDACKEKGIDEPTDEQISSYINDYGLHFEDFMADYIEHEGMFRCLKTPLEAFKEKINSINFGADKPTDDEIASFFDANGDDINKFCQGWTIKVMPSMERKLYLKTIEALSEENLVTLWNTFIEESGHYGEDSKIYDLCDDADCEFLANNMSNEDLLKVCDLVTKENVRFIQWAFLNDNSIKAADVSGIITTFWSEIFERIMLYPSCYAFAIDNDGSLYFDDVFFKAIAKEIGYIVDGSNGTIKRVEN